MSLIFLDWKAPDNTSEINIVEDQVKTEEEKQILNKVLMKEAKSWIGESKVKNQFQHST